MKTAKRLLKVILLSILAALVLSACEASDPKDTD
jgi:hypothetical protein